MREYGFSLTRILLYIRRESTILSLCRKIRVSKNPYSRIFYAVKIIVLDLFKNNSFRNVGRHSNTSKGKPANTNERRC